MKPLKIHLNGKRASRSLIKSMIDGFNSREIRTEKGGYLFKAAADESCLYLGVLPEFHMGERNYHYNIDLPGNPEILLSGSLTADGIYTILFIPKNSTLSEYEQKAYRQVYISFAKTMLSQGLKGKGELSMVTTMLLQSSGIMDPAPVSLQELSAYPYQESHN